MSFNESWKKALSEFKFELIAYIVIITFLLYVTGAYDLITNSNLINNEKFITSNLASKINTEIIFFNYDTGGYINDFFKLFANFSTNILYKNGTITTIINNFLSWFSIFIVMCGLIVFILNPYNTLNETLNFKSLKKIVNNVYLIIVLLIITFQILFLPAKMQYVNTVPNEECASYKELKVIESVNPKDKNQYTIPYFVALIIYIKEKIYHNIDSYELNIQDFNYIYQNNDICIDDSNLNNYFFTNKFNNNYSNSLKYFLFVGVNKKYNDDKNINYSNVKSSQLWINNYINNQLCKNQTCDFKSEFNKNVPDFKNELKLYDEPNFRFNKNKNINDNLYFYSKYDNYKKIMNYKRENPNFIDDFQHKNYETCLTDYKGCFELMTYGDYNNIDKKYSVIGFHNIKNVRNEINYSNFNNQFLQSLKKTSSYSAYFSDFYFSNEIIKVMRKQRNENIKDFRMFYLKPNEYNLIDNSFLGAFLPLGENREGEDYFSKHNVISAMFRYDNNRPLKINKSKINNWRMLQEREATKQLYSDRLHSMLFNNADYMSNIINSDKFFTFYDKSNNLDFELANNHLSITDENKTAHFQYVDNLLIPNWFELDRFYELSFDNINLVYPIQYDKYPNNPNIISNINNEFDDVYKIFKELNIIGSTVAPLTDKIHFISNLLNKADSSKAFKKNKNVLVNSTNYSINVTRGSMHNTTLRHKTFNDYFYQGILSYKKINNFDDIDDIDLISIEIEKLDEILTNIDNININKSFSFFEGIVDFFQKSINQELLKKKIKDIVITYRTILKDYYIVNNSTVGLDKYRFILLNSILVNHLSDLYYIINGEKENYLSKTLKSIHISTYLPVANYLTHNTNLKEKREELVSISFDKQYELLESVINHEIQTIYNFFFKSSDTYVETGEDCIFKIDKSMYFKNSTIITPNLNLCTYEEKKELVLQSIKALENGIYKYQINRLSANDSIKEETYKPYLNEFLNSFYDLLNEFISYVINENDSRIAKFFESTIKDSLDFREEIDSSVAFIFKNMDYPMYILLEQLSNIQNIIFVYMNKIFNYDETELLKNSDNKIIYIDNTDKSTSFINFFDYFYWDLNSKKYEWNYKTISDTNDDYDLLTLFVCVLLIFFSQIFTFIFFKIIAVVLFLIFSMYKQIKAILHLSFKIIFFFVVNYYHFFLIFFIFSVKHVWVYFYKIYKNIELDSNYINEIIEEFLFRVINIIVGNALVFIFILTVQIILDYIGFANLYIGFSDLYSSNPIGIWTVLVFSSIVLIYISVFLITYFINVFNISINAIERMFKKNKN